MKRKGRRAFIWFEYGSTSLSLLLLLALMGPFFERPVWSLLTLIGQGLLMAVVECFGRPLWVKESVPMP